ncbi:MAG: class I SAM-dependent methyltransferase [Pseudolabrys sp.]|nr:class I SAM-dependent methyltransferase [Pseudolabrys sp.]
MATPPQQIKSSEIAFFDGHAASGAYDVFAPETNARLIDIFVRLSRLPGGARIADLGCGSGVFSNLLRQRGYDVTGVDLSPKLINVAQAKFPGITFLEGDIEQLPFTDASFDGVLLGGVLHHLPDPSRCAAEVARILRPGGSFVAFDPNRMNPFMYLYRDRTSPFYSATGVTKNERPILADDIAATFRAAGFRTGTEFHSGLKYRYTASAAARRLLPLYNLLDDILFRPALMTRYRSFVITHGEKLQERA